MLFCRTGEVNGRFWLKESRDRPAGEAFLTNIIQDYDDIAADYEDLVRSWGYNMPEVVVNALVKHAHIDEQYNRNAEGDARVLQEAYQVVAEGGVWYREHAMNMCEAVVAANKKDIE